MDTLLSLPIVSVLLLPTLTSWSTSLNLLFFYLTWSTLLLSHSPLRVELIGTLLVRLVFYLLPSSLFLLFDSTLPGIAANVKEHGSNAVAVSEQNGGRGKKGRWWRVTGLSIANVLLGVLVQTGMEWLMTECLHLRSALRITTTLPMPWGIIKDVAKAYVLREVLTYALHRYVLHSPSSPPSRLHRRYYHSLPTPLPFSAHYDHPLSYLLRVFVPTYLPAFLFRFHLLTYYLFLALVSIEEALVYSGYTSLPSGLLLGRMARRTERHLMGKGNGNYGPYGVADFCCGTSLGQDVVDDLRDETERRDIPQRVGDRRRLKRSERDARREDYD